VSGRVCVYDVNGFLHPGGSSTSEFNLVLYR
jgi:hypothetical protein